MKRARDIERISMAEAFEGLHGDYQAARASRFRRRRTGYAPSGTGADYHYRSEGDYLSLIELARDMDRNDTIVGSTIDRAVTNSIQDGFVLNPQTGRDRTDRRIIELWNEWADDPLSCDAQGELCFQDLEWLTLRACFVDGDIFHIPLHDGQIESFEAHRARTPRRPGKDVIVHGVGLDAARRRVAYWFTDEPVDPAAHLSLNKGDFLKYPAYETIERDTPDGKIKELVRAVFHVYNPKRVTQTRGITALAPIFDCLGMFEDINFAKLVQQQIVSCFAIFREREAGIQTPATQAQGEQTTNTRRDGSTELIEGIGPGMQIDGLPGERLQGFSPNVPNPEFFDHVKLILTLVGINVGMPLVMVLMDARETNFSGWRGAVDQAKLGFKRNQNWLRRRFHSPVYRWKVRQWIADGLLEDRPEMYRHKWSVPNWPYIEPKKDADADVVRQDNRLISPRRLHAERGRDWDEVLREIVDDNEKLIDYAAGRATKLNSKHPEARVDWRDLANWTKEPPPDPEIAEEPETERAPGETEEEGQ